MARAGSRAPSPPGSPAGTCRTGLPAWDPLLAATLSGGSGVRADADGDHGARPRPTSHRRWPDSALPIRRGAVCATLTRATDVAGGSRYPVTTLRSAHGTLARGQWW